MKRISGAKVVGEQMSLDMESESNVEEVGGGSKRKKRIESGSKSCRRSARIRIACDLKKIGGAKQISLDMKSERNKQESGSKSRSGNRSRWPGNCRITSWVSPEPGALDKLFRQRGRKIVGSFNHDFVFGAVKSSAEGEASGGYDRTTLVWSGGYRSFPVPSSGITWVAVNGGNSISVATKKDQHVDKARLGDFLRNKPTENVLLRFMRAILVHHMEDPSSELRQRFEEGVEIRSFAAVSMALGSYGVHEEIFHEGSIARSGEGESINFLKEKVEKDLAFTYKETVQTAISALQRLHQENFKATSILVGVRKKGESCEAYLSTIQIKNHLEVIHEKPIVWWSSGV